MANKTLTKKSIYTYTDADGASQNKTTTVSVPYTSMVEGELDVPDQTAGSTAFTIPVGTIAKITGLYIKNNTTQELSLKINGSAALNNVPAGGTVEQASPDDAAASALASASLTTTATVDGAGTIAYKVYGDPV